MAKKSITRLLAERKALENRITKATGAPFIGIKKGTKNNEPIGYVGKSLVDVETILKGNFDKVNGLIAYYQRITALIIQSNATTEVTIAGKGMKVAVAIERKKSILFERQLLATLITQAQANQAGIARANAEVEVTIERQLKDQTSGDKSKLTEEIRKATSDFVESSQKQSPIDPNNITAYATVKLDELNGFLTEVDFALSEINARTEVDAGDEHGPAVPETATEAAAAAAAAAAAEQEHGTLVLELNSAGPQQ